MRQFDKTLAALFVLFAASLPLSAQTSVQQKNVRESMLVTTAWLQEHLNDPSLVIIHVGTNRREYRDGHIQGARFLWNQSLAYSDPDQTLEVPPLAQADSVLRDLGVSEKNRLILYFDGSNVSPTTRVFFTLDYLGLGDRIAMLDGGLDAWKAEGRPVITEFPNSAPGTFKPVLRKNLVVSGDWLKENLSNPAITIIDARAPQYYSGVGGGMPRPGHIPNAINIPFSTLIDKEGDENTLYRVDREVAEKGLKIMAEKYPHHFRNFIDEQDDAITADVFLQCCVFEELIYG